MIQGCVVDEVSKECLPFANIRVVETSIGCVTNDEGKFKLILPNEYLDNKLSISFVGYRTFNEDIRNLNRSNLIVELTPVATELPEVKIIPPDPIDVIVRAIENMDRNYWDKPINIDAFYRELLFENDQAKQLTEAACLFYLEPFRFPYIWKESAKQISTGPEYSNLDKGNPLIEFPFTRPPSNQVVVCEARTNYDNSLNNANFYISGGPLALLSLDLLNYKYNYFFPQEDNFKKAYRGIKKSFQSINLSYSEYDGKPIYVILLKKKISDWIFYIDRASYAIIKYQCTIRHNDEQVIAKFNNHEKDRKAKKEKLVTDSTITSVNYMMHNGTWHYASVKHSAYFSYFPLSGEMMNLRTEREFMVKSIKVDHVSTFDKDSCFTNNSFVSLYDYPIKYNSDFWESYTSLYPTELQAKIKNDLELYQPLVKQFEGKFIFDSLLQVPKAKIIADSLIIGGETFYDNYAWMQYGDEDSINAYVTKENAFCDNYFGQISDMTRQFVKEISYTYAQNFFDLDNNAENSVYGGYEYFTDFENSFNGVFSRRNLTDTTKKDKLIDFDKILKVYPKFGLIKYGFNPDTTIFYYTYLPYGEDYYFDIQTTFIDLTTNRTIDSVETFVGAWVSNTAFCFSEKTNENDYYHRKCFLYDLLTQKNSLIFECNNNEQILFRNSKSGEYVFIEPTTPTSQRLFCFKTNSYPIVIDTIIPEHKGFDYQIEHYKNSNCFYILSDYNAPNFCLYEADVNDVKQEHWVQVIPESDNFEIVSARLLDSVFVLTIKDGLSQNIAVYDTLNKTCENIIKSKGLHYSSIIRVLSNRIIIKDETYLSPANYFKFDLKTSELNLLGADSINNYNSKNYEYVVKYAKSSDGFNIPIVLISHKNTKLKNTPVYAMTYGGGGKVYAPHFDEALVPILDQGFAVAYILVRGGGESGLFLQKSSIKNQSVSDITDFATGIEYLILNEISSPDKIFAYGKSNGGFIMGNMANYYPEYFNGIILDVPYFDVLTDFSNSDNYFYLGSIENPDEFNNLKKIDPYQNIKPQDYPNLLFFGALQDINVEPSSYIKAVAKLRQTKTDNNVLLLRVLMNSGHGVDLGKIQQKQAMIYSFMLNCLPKE
ncbi:MAG: prolyl oligopeptidase family serine peptidase [Bacteroidales bacterium]|nr:prolyl oligopeptidase family serine peptidase [Bacteroidales bacterium]